MSFRFFFLSQFKAGPVEPTQVAFVVCQHFFEGWNKIMVCKHAADFGIVQCIPHPVVIGGKTVFGGFQAFEFSLQRVKNGGFFPPFIRFFAKNAGQPPSAFRIARRDSPSEGSRA